MQARAARSAAAGTSRETRARPRRPSTPRPANKRWTALALAGRSRSSTPTLEVSRPGDASERAAERTAERVLSEREPGPVDSPGRDRPATLLRSAERGSDSTPAGGRAAHQPAGSAILGSLGTGRPLPEAARGFFEHRFGRSFEDVRVHDGDTADRAARSVEARAFTFGADIVFAGGAFDTGSNKGRELLAHELAHVAAGPDRAGARIERSPAPEGDKKPPTEKERMVEALSAEETRWLRHLLIAGRPRDGLLSPKLTAKRDVNTENLALAIFVQRFQRLRPSDPDLMEWYFGRRKAGSKGEKLFQKFRREVVAPAYDAVIKDLGDLVKQHRPDATKGLSAQDPMTLFAMNLLSEAGTYDYFKTGRPALEAIAQVVMNRQRCGFAGAKTTSQVITAANQFSWTGNPAQVTTALRPTEMGAPIPAVDDQRKGWQAKETRARLWLEALDVSREALSGKVVSPTVKNATHYLNPGAAARQPFSNRANFIARVGLHCFYQTPTGCDTKTPRDVDPASCKSPCHC